MINEHNDTKTVLIIDFGLCDKIIKNGKHVEHKLDQGLRGTYIYMSRNAMRGESQSRRDDWESLCYVIYELINKELPWHWE